MELNSEDPEIMLNGLTVLKLLLSMDGSTLIAIKQYNQMTVFLLKVIDAHKHSFEILKASLNCLQSVLSAGKAATQEQRKSILTEVLQKP